MMVELSEEERAALIDLLVGIIEHDLFPLSRRIQLLRSILAKIRPMPALPPDEPAEIDDKPAGLRTVAAQRVTRKKEGSALP